MIRIGNDIINVAVSLLGITTRRKIIVFESDDWGSVRMPNRTIYNELISQGFQIESRPYERVDSIAREDDLELLFDILSKYKDSLGNHPIITAMTVMASPDIIKIQDSNFTEYFYKKLIDVLQDYSRSKNSILSLWKEGIDNHLFFPQFHGREHINVCNWLKHVKEGNNDNRLAFDYGIPGFFDRSCPERGNIFAKALKFNSLGDLEFMKFSIADGLKIFLETFGYKASSFMAPAYTWNDDIENVLSQGGVKFIQSEYYQNKPLLGNRNQVVHHYFGQRNKYGQHYLLRNCSFEPSQNNYSQQVVDDCLRQIAIAFSLHKPATISTHRLNYIGAIRPENRDCSLKMLDSLLNNIVKVWPDVEFMTSVEVGKYIIG